MAARRRRACRSTCRRWTAISMSSPATRSMARPASACCGRSDELLEAMPPFQGGGDMILNVTFEKTTFQEPPHALRGRHARHLRRDRPATRARLCRSLGRDAIAAHEAALTGYGVDRLSRMPGVRLVGAGQRRLGILSFDVDGIHPHDLAHPARPARRRGARRPSLRPAADGQARPRRDHARLVRRLQRRERHRRARRAPSRRRKRCSRGEHDDGSARSLSGHHPRSRPPPAEFPQARRIRAISRTATTRCAATASPSMSTLDGDRIKDVSFEGRGCAISTASASLMTEILKGKTLAEAEALFKSFRAQGHGRGRRRRAGRRSRTTRAAGAADRRQDLSRARQMRDAGLARFRGRAEERRRRRHRQDRVEPWYPKTIPSISRRSAARATTSSGPSPGEPDAELMERVSRRLKTVRDPEIPGEPRRSRPDLRADRQQATARSMSR